MQGQYVSVLFWNVKFELANTWKLLDESDRLIQIQALHHTSSWSGFWKRMSAGQMTRVNIQGTVLLLGWHATIYLSLGAYLWVSARLSITDILSREASNGVAKSQNSLRSCLSFFSQYVVLSGSPSTRKVVPLQNIGYSLLWNLY